MVYRFTLVAMIVFKFPGYPVVYGCVSYPREFIISMYGPKSIKGDFKILTLVKKKFKKEIKIIFSWGIVPAPSKFLYL